MDFHQLRFQVVNDAFLRLQLGLKKLFNHLLCCFSKLFEIGSSSLDLVGSNRLEGLAAINVLHLWIELVNQFLHVSHWALKIDFYVVIDLGIVACPRFNFSKSDKILQMRCDRSKLKHLSVDFFYFFDLALALFHKFDPELLDLLFCVFLNFAFILLQNFNLLTLKWVHILKSLNKRFLLINLNVIIFSFSTKQVIKVIQLCLNFINDFLFLWNLDLQHIFFMFNLQVFFFQKLVAALLVWNLSFGREQLLLQNFNNHWLSWALWASWGV